MEKHWTEFHPEFQGLVSECLDGFSRLQKGAGPRYTLSVKAKWRWQWISHVTAVTADVTADHKTLILSSQGSVCVLSGQILKQER